MSDTDDTDDLLIIPPDFFTINTALELEDSLQPPYYTIVDTLITHFNSLEDRINHIEAISDNSFMNSSLDSGNFMTSGVRRFNSLDELSKPGSTQSTPQKPKTKTLQNSLPSSPNVDNLKLTHRRRYGRQQQGPIGTTNLNEINNFISHVQNIQKHDTARNLSLLFERKDVEKPTETLWRRDGYLNSSQAAAEPTVVKENVWRTGDTKGSVPDYNMGMRDLLYKDDKSVLESLSSVRNSYDTSSASSSESTQRTAVNRHDALVKHATASPQSTDRHPTSTVQQRKLVMMSLSELWNQDSVGPAGDYSSNRENLKVSCKIQEEKLRRQHCEDLIQRLQAKNLELQQQVAVALQVDDAKDDAILKIHKSWEEASAQIDNLQKDKSHLESQLVESNTKASAELLEATRKIAHYESESSKALNLAHSNQEKVAALEKQNVALQGEVQLCEDRLRKIELDYEHQHSHNQQLSQLLGQREVELNENKTIQAQATQEVAQSKRAVELCQAELTAIKEKQTQLESRYNETLTQIKGLEDDKKKLATVIENYKKTEKNLKDELSRMKETNEHGKMELRTYYQNQVEILVREKLKEFQQQLEKAEGLLHEEMQSRELSMARNAAAHMQQLNEKNILEIHLLQEKHKEEIKLYKLQLFQSQQEIGKLQSSFQHQQERRANVVQQLQKVMEAQWSEALKIINNGKSPVVAQEKSTSTIDQLDHLKSRSYNNVEEILMKEDGGVARKLALQRSSVAPSGKLVENDDFIETPLSSRSDKNRHGDIEIQKYIQMLLSKQPGHPLEDQSSKHQDFNEQSQIDPGKLKAMRDRLGKPPWK